VELPSTSVMGEVGRRGSGLDDVRRRQRASGEGVAAALFQPAGAHELHDDATEGPVSIRRHRYDSSQPPPAVASHHCQEHRRAMPHTLLVSIYAIGLLLAQVGGEAFTAAQVGAAAALVGGWRIWAHRGGSIGRCGESADS
jgi:hypothetical protein